MERVSDWIVGGMMTLFGLVGAVMAIGARDEEIFIFGFSLAVFAGIFNWSIYKRQQAARAAAVTVRGGRNG